MKVLFCGLGSMGTRHLRNLRQLMAEEQEKLVCHALRSTRISLEMDVQGSLDREFYSWAETDEYYDCIFITNPTALHYEALQQAVLHTKKIFIEKSVFLYKENPRLDRGVQ